MVLQKNKCKTTKDLFCIITNYWKHKFQFIVKGVNNVKRSQLNEIYRKLDGKAQELGKLLQCAYGYYNGHYHKNIVGNYEMDYFPIPVISIKDLCDVEIDLKQISITTKLTRDKALSYDFEKVKSYNFEVYGAEEYLDDFYVVGDTISGMIEKIKASKEENIFFSFYFPFEVSANIVSEFVNFIGKEGFFY